MFKQEKVTELIRELAARYLTENATKQSMITVTGVKISSDLSRATVIFTVYPETNEDAAVAFVKRRRKDFRDYVRTKSRLRKVPFFEFALDLGEKNRQRIDELSQEAK
jgi:ribosome-binding factor A